jgi:uncharacterized SAM-binding protein YcdF (DUF218 family)
VSAPAVVVLGNSNARVCRRLVAAGQRIARAVSARTVILSGGSGGDGPTEAERMHAFWRGSPGIELVLEEAAATTAQNAARTLPLLLERGVTEAVVVCAPMHLPRTRWIFERIYGRHGIAVRCRAGRVVPTPGALLWELGALAVTARQVRAELESQ